MIRNHRIVLPRSYDIGILFAFISLLTSLLLSSILCAIPIRFVQPPSGRHQETFLKRREELCKPVAAQVQTVQLPILDISGDVSSVERRNKAHRTLLACLDTNGSGSHMVWNLTMAVNLSSMF